MSEGPSSCGPVGSNLEVAKEPLVGLGESGLRLDLIPDLPALGLPVSTDVEPSQLENCLPDFGSKLLLPVREALAHPEVEEVVYVAVVLAEPPSVRAHRAYEVRVGAVLYALVFQDTPMNWIALSARVRSGQGCISLLIPYFTVIANWAFGR